MMRILTLVFASLLMLAPSSAQAQSPAELLANHPMVAFAQDETFEGGFDLRQRFQQDIDPFAANNLPDVQDNVAFVEGPITVVFRIGWA